MPDVPMSDCWNQRFATEDYLYGTEPNAYLASKAAFFKPGMRAIVPADGEGRNGAWLVGQGLEGVSIDSSAVGLAKAGRLARRRGVTIARIEADLCRWAWPVAEFDLCVAVFVHFDRVLRAAPHARMIGALRPGGPGRHGGLRRRPAASRQRRPEAGGTALWSRRPAAPISRPSTSWN